jgi:anti-sigma regulatory factor (Ser/Thr protein kinase)
VLIEVSEPSQIGDVRRRATALADRLELGEARCGGVALAVTEIATNLLKHARRGYIVVDRLDHNGAGLRVLGVDKGPGIAHVGKALTEGYSTAGSMGTGLGATRRVSDSFDLYSSPVVGTVVEVEFWTKGRASRPRTTPVEIAVLSEPIRGEQ